MDDRMLHEYRRSPDPRFARDLRERLRRSERPRGVPRPVVRALAVACALGVVVALFAVPSVRVSAQAVLDIFRVRRFAPVEFNQARIEALRSIEKERGLLVFDRQETLRPGATWSFPSREGASDQAGFAVAAPAYLPDSLAPESVFVHGEEAMRFSVSEAKLRDLLARLDVKGVSVPHGLEDGWVEVHKPPVVVQRFRSAKRKAVLIQAPSPEVSVPAGWDMEQLGEIGLRILGLDAGEARRMARATDWRSTLLVPVPLDVASFRQVTIRGNSGLLITTTGEAPADGRPRRRGAMLMWADGDKIYCLRGDLSAKDTIRMAESIAS
jgi:hypothetical protein